jgi:hypothetical protein
MVCATILKINGPKSGSYGTPDITTYEKVRVPEIRTELSIGQRILKPIDITGGKSEVRKLTKKYIMGNNAKNIT